jgi:hypothetical protein
VNTAWRNALKKSGIEDFRFHDTRHTWAGLLIQNGVPKSMIKEMGGWKSDFDGGAVCSFGTGASGKACRGAGCASPIARDGASSRLEVLPGSSKKQR